MIGDVAAMVALVSGLVPEDGRLRIEICGELAKILTLASAGQARGAYADAKALCVQVKMVAGARNHLDLLLTG